MNFYIPRVKRRAIFMNHTPGPNIPDFGVRSVSAYASKYNIDFIVKRGKKYCTDNSYVGPPCLEKLMIPDLMSHYDQILSIDADILVTEKAPNIFEEDFDQDKLIALDESLYDSDCLQTVPHFENLLNFKWPTYRNHRGEDVPKYHNTGVVLYNKKTVDILQYMVDNPGEYRERVIHAGWPEQGWHSIIALRLGIELESLPYVYNYLLGFQNTEKVKKEIGPKAFDQRFEANFIHYTGPNITEKRIQLMEEDFKSSKILS